MKAHISDSYTRSKLEIESKLLEIRQAGLAAGTKAVSQVIYNIATNEDKTLEQRMEEIIKFCSVGLAIKQGKTEEEES